MSGLASEWRESLDFDDRTVWSRTALAGPEEGSALVRVFPSMRSHRGEVTREEWEVFVGTEWVGTFPSLGVAQGYADGWLCEQGWVLSPEERDAFLDYLDQSETVYPVDASGKRVSWRTLADLPPAEPLTVSVTAATAGTFGAFVLMEGLQASERIISAELMDRLAASTPGSEIRTLADGRRGLWVPLTTGSGE